MPLEYVSARAGLKVPLRGRGSSEDWRPRAQHAIMPIIIKTKTIGPTMAAHGVDMLAPGLDACKWTWAK